jgi:lipopolysaccharide export system protein LptA
VAFALAAVTVVVYLNRDWRRYLEGKKAPPPAPVDVSRQSNGINFKKVDGNRTIFAVEASRSTEFKDQDASLLEEVKITIFGKSEERHDTIHTHSCRYSKADGAIACSGDVQIDLLSAADAARTAGNEAAGRALTVHVETRKVTFDRGSGVARTDAPVTFVFPGGSGDAVGMEYKSDEGTVRLMRAVRFSLTEPAASGGNAAGGNSKAVAESSAQEGAGREVRVTAASLDFGRDTRLLLLHGPTEAVTARERLTAGEISLTLDKDFHAEKLIAATGGNGGRPVIVSQGTPSQVKLDADVLTAYFAAGGDVAKVEASGKVHGWRDSATEKNEMTAEKGIVDLWPKVGQPKLMNLSGNVVVRTEIAKAESVRVLRTQVLQMKFGEARLRQPSKLEKAETLSAGTVEWTDVPSAKEIASAAETAGAGGTGQKGKGMARGGAGQGASGAKTKLQAGKLEMDFGAQGKAKQLLATENVQTERTLPGHAVQTATANNGVAELLETGGWSRMNLQGNVKLVDGDRTGQAERAVFERVAQTALLAGQAVVRDATTETRAPQITFAQTSGEIHAEGGVRSTDFSAKGSGVQLANGPLNVTADTLRANAKSGRALYTGHARLWQGDSVMEAESIEMQREKGVLIATGRVRAVFPQAAAQVGVPAVPGPAPGRAAVPAPGKPGGASVASGSGGKSGGSILVTIAPMKKTDLWHATCGVLTYLQAEGRAHLEKDVVVQSAAQRMRGPVLDLYFTRSESTGGATTANGKNSGSGSQQVSRAVGTGGVVVEEGGRKATAERGEYSAADGKFVMSGGNPTIYDGSAGTTTGRQLTFFLADDTIIVDSEKGTQTLTKHRVQK